LRAWLKKAQETRRRELVAAVREAGRCARWRATRASASPPCSCGSGEPSTGGWTRWTGPIGPRGRAGLSRTPRPLEDLVCAGATGTEGHQRPSGSLAPPSSEPTCWPGRGRGAVGAHGRPDSRAARRARCPPAGAPAPAAAGWYLPAVAHGDAELESVDIIEGLYIRGGPHVEVINLLSFHGGVVASWPTSRVTAKTVVDALVEHWRALGLPRTSSSTTMPSSKAASSPRLDRPRDPPLLEPRGDPRLRPAAGARVPSGH